MTDVPPPEDPDVFYPWEAMDAKREERDWNHESQLRGQETKNQVWFLKAYGMLRSDAAKVAQGLFDECLKIYPAN